MYTIKTNDNIVEAVNRELEENENSASILTFKLLPNSTYFNKLQKFVTPIKLYKGNIVNAGTTSPYSLYSEEYATFGEDAVYNQNDSAGFINLFGLPITVQAKMNAAKKSEEK